jgi:rhodanese-related sulfurtransferase
MKEISFEELESWKKSDKDFELIDVREPWENELFNIGGKLIPLGEIITRKDEIDISGKPIVVYCKRGIRSQIAIQRLEKYFEDAEFYNLERGVWELKR